MNLNPGIILSGRAPNVLGALAGGTEAAKAATDLQRQNALAAMFAQQGPGIMQGDPNALNALAQFDPAAALGIQQTRQQMTISADDAAQRREAARRQGEEYARKVGAEAAAAEREKLTRGLQAAAMFHKNGDRQGYDNFLRSQGLDPAQIPFDQFPMIAVSMVGLVEGLGPAETDPTRRYRVVGNQLVDLEAPNGPSAVFDGAGQTETIFDPSTGRPIITRGPSKNAQQTEKALVDADQMLATIDGILEDPALSSSTGVFSPLQVIPGTPQRRFATRARQLEGQAFLRAFESLKGGGAITEIEGQKATQAIGRLDTAQSAEDYRQSLGELREVVTAARARLTGQAYTMPPGDVTAMPPNAAPAGVPADPPGAGIPPQAMSNPMLTDAANRAGVTVEELWQFLSDDAKQRFMQ